VLFELGGCDGYFDWRESVLRKALNKAWLAQENSQRDGHLNQVGEDDFYLGDHLTKHRRLSSTDDARVNFRAIPQ
jgi:hypothetical protein